MALTTILDGGAAKTCLREMQYMRMRDHRKDRLAIDVYFWNFAKKNVNRTYFRLLYNTCYTNHAYVLIANLVTCEKVIFHRAFKILLIPWNVGNGSCFFNFWISKNTLQMSSAGLPITHELHRGPGVLVPETIEFLTAPEFCIRGKQASLWSY